MESLYGKVVGPAGVRIIELSLSWREMSGVENSRPLKATLEVPYWEFIVGNNVAQYLSEVLIDNRPPNATSVTIGFSNLVNGLPDFTFDPTKCSEFQLISPAETKITSSSTIHHL